MKDKKVKIKILHVYSRSEAYRPLETNYINHEFLQVDRGEEALEYLKALPYENRPNLIFIDLHFSLSGICSVELLQKIRNTECLHTIPAVILTSSSDLVMINPQLWRPFKDYIFKPLTSTMLKKILSVVGLDFDSKEKNHPIL
jgi:two-component SAPR family response regulator